MSAGKVKVGGAAYTVSGGNAKIENVKRAISKGQVKIGGVVKTVSFGSSPPIYSIDLYVHWPYDDSWSDCGTATFTGSTFEDLLDATITGGTGEYNIWFTGDDNELIIHMQYAGDSYVSASELYDSSDGIVALADTPVNGAWYYGVYTAG